MKINKITKAVIALITVFSIGGGCLNPSVCAAYTTSNISIEDPAGILSSYTGTGKYQNGKKYNIKAQPVDSNNFTGWLLKNGSSYTDVAGVSDRTNFSFIADNSKTYVPNRNYSITYNLNGGSVATANPTTYSLKDSFTLNNPTRSYYNFSGWTGTGLSSASTAVAIPQGSSGNKSYTANWTENPIKGSVTMNPGIANVPDNVYYVVSKRSDGSQLGRVNNSSRGVVTTTIDIMPNGTLVLASEFMDLADGDITIKGVERWDLDPSNIPIPADVSSANISMRINSGTYGSFLTYYVEIK